MSSTNKTPNYELPQFVANDVPSWLGDFNQAMSKIDTQMKANDSKAQSAETNAENANSSATQALETANQANTTANGANTNATNALSLATTANDNASTAKQNSETALSTANTANGLASAANSTAQNANTNATKALNNLEKFNLKNYKNYGANDMIGIDGISNITNSGINIAYDDTSSVFKLYGEVNCNLTPGNTGKIRLQNSPFRPSEDIQINDVGIGVFGNSVSFVNMQIKTNGDIYLLCWNGTGGNGQIGLFNCLYFLDAFDQITPTTPES